jgi:hexosaminidase
MRLMFDGLPVALVLFAAAVTGPLPQPAGAAAQEAPAPAVVPKPSVIPKPQTLEIDTSKTFPITSKASIVVPAGNADLARIGGELSTLLAPALDGRLAVTPGGTDGPQTIALRLDSSNNALGEEGYEIRIDADRATVTARTAAGVFYGVQTLRQLLPSAVEYRALRPRAIALPSGRVVDRPRFAWRGAMLDVARHFFDVDDVKHYIDLITLYKLNHLHLHLSDDQGWRVEITSWPNLTAHGAKTAVGGGPGGFYTQADYREIVRYAGERFVTIVPEIDVPTHINAALASYPELNCDGKAPDLYTGIEVGFSSLCVDKDITYKFLTDVFRELAAMTPGQYLHVGGDEVKKLTPDQYRAFIERVLGIVVAQGKQPIGWDEIAQAKRPEGTLVQHWRPDFKHGTEDMRLIISPAHKAYLDMKYDPSTPIGLEWAARIEVRDAYDWEPVTLAGVSESAIVGVEAPIWSETLQTMDDVEYMAFPRLAAIAEIAWSPSAARQWDDFRTRVAAHGPRWSALGVNFYRSPQVEWER